MAKTRTQFLCNHCGSVHPKWMGKCPDCGTWDSLEEYKTPTFDARAERAAAPNPSATGDLMRGGEAVPIDEIDDSDSPRLPSGIGEFDRILGGGIVPGSAVLIGGEPGIGKSTLLLQVAREVAKGRPGHEGMTGKKGDASSPHPPIPSSPPRVLYVTSEESARQTRMRASRLGVESSNLLVLAETNVERIINQ